MGMLSFNQIDSCSFTSLDVKQRLKVTLACLQLISLYKSILNLHIQPCTGVPLNHEHCIILEHSA